MGPRDTSYMKVTGSEPYVTPEHIVDSRCMLQWGACVCAAIKKCSSRVPNHPSAAGGVEDTALTEEGQTRSVGSTAASGDRGTGQEEYPVQADQGHQGPHRDREVSSTHHLITPLIPSLHCHSFQPPTSCPYTPYPAHAITASLFRLPPSTPPPLFCTGNSRRQKQRGCCCRAKCQHCSRTCNKPRWQACCITAHIEHKQMCTLLYVYSITLAFHYVQWNLCTV